MNKYVSQYLAPTELANYGLPTPDCNPRIMNLVQLASAAVDEWCGRVDNDGNGSLVWTTYTERILVTPRGGNVIVQLGIKPLVGIDPNDVLELQTLASASGDNTVYTGVQGNTITQPNGTLSCILSASGRFGPRRDGMSGFGSSWLTLTNPMDLSVYYNGGAPPWQNINPQYMDFSPTTGEVWIPTGFQSYNEVSITYNAGFDPRAIPRAVKFAVASVVKNALAKGEATTAMTSLTLGRAGASFQFETQLIDNTIDGWLTPYKIVRGS